MRDRRQPEVIAGRVNADGSIAAGDGFTAQKTGTGAYVLTLSAGFRIVGVTLTTLSPGSWGHTTTITGNTVSVSTYNTSVIAADMAFNVVAVGIQQ